MASIGIILLPSKFALQLNGNFIYNGIDRMDNSLGYTADNVVTCCGVCNKAKLAMTVEEFREWVRRVYAHFACSPNDVAEGPSHDETT